MNERGLRSLVDKAEAGRPSRRGFIRRLTAAGLTAPMATQLLALSGLAMAQSRPVYKPTKRGGGGLLKVMWWQGADAPQLHFAVGTKDQDASRLFYEPLAAWDRDGNLRPKLAASIPNRADGTLSADGLWVAWKAEAGRALARRQALHRRRRGLHLAVFERPGHGHRIERLYRDVTVEKVDDHAVRVKFKQPTPFWADTFVGWAGCIIPKHLFADYIGAKSREAPTNLKPVGTGPYKFKDFKPGDLVTGEINTDYHEPNRPHFDAIEMKGGGDAVLAARAVLQTGEYHFAWNMQVEDEILVRMEKGGKGRVIVTLGGGIEHMQLNTTDPWTEVDGER